MKGPTCLTCVFFVKHFYLNVSIIKLRTFVYTCKQWGIHEIPKRGEGGGGGIPGSVEVFGSLDLLSPKRSPDCRNDLFFGYNMWSEAYAATKWINRGMWSQ